MDKIFEVLTEVAVSLRSSGRFSLYPGDMILCDEIDVQSIYDPQRTYRKISIKTLKYKMSDVGFNKNPKQFHELKLKEEGMDNIFVASRNQYLTITNCVKFNYIEDVTRDEKLKELLYEE